jgi:GNAT superfamily N-acetyltransferase
MMDRSAVRNLTRTDLTDALDLSKLAGWNQTEADWRRLLTLSPEGCFCIEQEGRVVATATLVAYDRDCAWIGMVLTHPNWRGRGFARMLVGHTLTLAGSLGIGRVKLDATAHGQGLYQSFGFTAEQEVERWERPGISAPNEYPESYSLSLDQAAYGYSRADLLASLNPGARPTARANGYALTRPGLIRSYLGPCIAEDLESATQLLTAILNGVPGSGWFWDLLVENRYAMALASALGFRPARKLVRMSLGPPLREREEKIYALAGFEFG